MNIVIGNLLHMIFIKKIKYLLISFFIFILLLLAILFVFYNGGKFTAFDLTNSFSLSNFIGMFSTMLCGFGLTGVGAASQSINRNNLAGPSTLGFLPAVTLGIVSWSIINKLDQIWLLYILCFVISFFVLIFNLLFLNTRNSLNSDYRIVLVGITMGAILSAISIWVAQSNSSIGIVVNNWIGGGGINYNVLRLIISTPFIILGLLIIYLNSHKLNIVQQNVVLATSLGIRVKRLYFIIGLASIIVVTSSVILLGSILFIGIVIPHLTRMVTKTKNNWSIIPLSGVLSSILLISSLFLVNSFSLGINFLIAIVSTPIFINLLRRGKL